MLKVLSLFSGIGAFERAFCRIGLDWELVNYCEIDRWASLSYSMVNQCSESLNLRDVQCQRARVFNPNGLSATITASDYKEPPQISVIGQLKGGEKGRVVDPDGIGRTLTATEYKDPLKIAEPGNTRTVRIRKLTPRECWRLMGFMDEEFDRVHGISNSQLYKQAGNSIVVNVLSALLSQLFYKELV